MEPRTGVDFYDDATVFETYSEHRRQADTANETLERPIVRELLGAVGGLAVLDLGCGDAGFGTELLRDGAGSYLGVDASANMVAAAARTLAGSAGRVLQSPIESWDYPSAAFDAVVARLSLHYVADLPGLCELVLRALRPGGAFVFSVEHPLITSCDPGPRQGERQGWRVDDYFDTGRRETSWMGGRVVKFHRTVEDHFSALAGAGFAVTSVRESAPRRERFESEETYLRWRRIPLFLFMAARKRAVEGDAG